ncbi:PREDICTED: stress response protein NST1-like [Branchiostoma belcheri]|uniref:Stress response protein NST1-like n=1 Tax=Branchiostoma belcheri TaxID=7741 RepID=A0A6P5A0G4_BRABE|nr:PREDICTED: stress response protein NST1-like [Branchiostoma belcheri]
MWDFLISVTSCLCCFKTPNKVSPAEEEHVEEVRAPGEEEMDRGTTECKLVTTQPPMSQPRPSKSESDVLAELRQEGVLPIKARGDSVAFQVLVVQPAPEPDAPPRRPVRLEKLEENLQERRKAVKKATAGSRHKLRQELSEAASRRQAMLEERSRRLAERAAKIKAKTAANKSTGTVFVISSASDTDAIAARDPAKAQALERRLDERRERVAKRKTTAAAMEKRQALAAERRRDKMAETVFKARMSRMTKGLGWEEADLAMEEPLETYQASDGEDEGAW